MGVQDTFEEVTKKRPNLKVSSYTITTFTSMKKSPCY